MVNIPLLKRTFLGFWGVWWLLAFMTDLLGGLKHMGVLQATWILDTNYPFLVQSLKMYHSPTWLTVSFFLLIMLGSLLASVTFLISFISKHWRKLAKYGYIVSMLLWLGFFIADQAIMNFDLEENHMVQGGFELLTMLAFYLLPE